MIDWLDEILDEFHEQTVEIEAERGFDVHYDKNNARTDTEEAYADAKQAILAEIDRGVGLLRQMLNEEYIGKNKLITSAEIKFFLGLIDKDQLKTDKEAELKPYKDLAFRTKLGLDKYIERLKDE